MNETFYFDKLVALSYGASWQKLFAQGIFHLTWAVALLPLFFRSVMLVASFTVRWQQCRGLLADVVGWFVCLLGLVIASTGHGIISRVAETSTPGLVVHAVVSVTVAVTATLYLTGRLRLRRTPRGRTPSSLMLPGVSVPATGSEDSANMTEAADAVVLERVVV